MRFGEKYCDLILSDNKGDILEGTTYSGKTTVGIGVKFMTEIMASKKMFHGLAGKDLGTIEKNIINSENGLLAEWGSYLQYFGRGRTDVKLPHLVFWQDDGSYKVIYVFGYDDKARWQKVLGGQLGVLGVDEANIADIDFLREVMIRCDYFIWTLNPDNPDLPIYEEYINHSRPMKKHEGDYPRELLGQLNLEPKAGWCHWYFTFYDNIACSEEKRLQIIENAPPGTKLHKNKVLGLRGVGEGALYAGYMHDGLVVDYGQINTNALQEIICSVDMGTAKGLDDKKHAHTIATVVGFSRGYQRIIVLDAWVIPSNNLRTIVEEVDKHLIPYWANYYSKLTKIVIDYGDSGDMLIRSWRDMTQLKRVQIKAAVKSGKVYGVSNAINLQSRAQLKCQLIWGGYLLWSTKATESFKAHRNILSTEDGEELEQSNMDNDYADSLTYALTENWGLVSNISITQGSQNDS